MYDKSRPVITLRIKMIAANLKKIPPETPSQVFFGEIFGTNLVFPNNDPEILPYDKYPKIMLRYQFAKQITPRSN
jgi:hypothetical protein